MRRFFALAGLALALAACGPIPQPFQGTRKVTTDIAILDVPSAVGIAILPTTGLPQPLNGQLAAATAKALEPYEIPAEPVPVNKGLGFSLESSVLERSEQNGTVTAMLTWTLKSRAGQKAGAYTQAITLSAAEWDRGGPAIANRLGREAAGVVSEMIDGAGRLTDRGATAKALPQAPRPPAPRPIRVSVRPMEGAPGDGRESLQLATIEILLNNGAKRDDMNPDVVLMGRVEVQPAASSQDFVIIAWRAITQDGTDLGEVKLTNTIPKGSLDGRWGATAFGIAEASLPDLLRLLSAAPRL